MNKQLIVKIKLLYLVLLLVAGAIVAQILYLQHATDLGNRADRNAYTREEIEANRGSILAKDGRFLAASIPYYQIRIDCLAPHRDTFNRDIDGLSAALSQFFRDKSAAAYKRELLSTLESGNRYKAIGNRNVTYAELEQIKQFPLFRRGANRGGLIAVQKNRRSYPYNRLASRTIGFINDQGQGAGIENAFDHQLKGQPGMRVIHRLSQRPLTSNPEVLPVDGFDVQTTIDIDIQEAVERALRNQLAKSTELEGATAVVMEVQTGAIRAIANLTKTDDGDYDERYNYAVGMATEPGSTFKLATLTALLEDDRVSLSSVVDVGNGRWNYGGLSISDVSRAGGPMSVLEAFEKSSNVAFAKMAVQHFAGRESRFLQRLYDMKVSENLKLDISGGGAASLRAREDRSPWHPGSLPMMAIGYQVQLTPLHVLTFYNAIANGGKMMRPYLVESLKKHGQTERLFKPQVISGAICSKSTADSLQKALRHAVKEGTARSIDNPRYGISGKTGTAQIAFGSGGYREEGYHRHQASFAGFFPSERPRYSVIVVLYSQKTRRNFYGGSWAAPVFREIADKIYSFSTDWNEPVIREKTPAHKPPQALAGNDTYEQEVRNILEGKAVLSKSTPNWSRPISDGTVPNVVGMGLRDALYLLERNGLKVQIKGVGDVEGQYPPPGTPLQGVNSVEITLRKNNGRRPQIAGR
ncbi:MAG: transpeptidase family protein [Bacteroidales bacterium]|nr:transpeptidase family protein [Bacteroidales bacterium]